MSKKRKNLHDLADESAYEAREKQGNIKELKSQEEFRYLLSLPQFRSWLYKLMLSCHMDESSFTGNSTTFFNEGARDVAINLKTDIKKADFKAWLKMEEEDYLEGIVEKEKLNG